MCTGGDGTASAFREEPMKASVALAVVMILCSVPAEVSSQAVRAPSGWENPYGDVGGVFERSFREGQRQGREDEEALATVRAYVSMYPDAFPPGFLQGVTSANARGVRPVVEFRVREYLRRSE